MYKHLAAYQRRVGVFVCGLLLIIGGCGGGGGGSSAPAPATPPSNPPPTPAPPPVVATSAFVASSPFAEVLQPCTYAGDATQGCTLDTLPFIGQQHSDPSLSQIMDRVLVSHDWMGQNFRSALLQLPDDLLLLMRSVTAIVIASDVRPAFYDPDTGAIYLDPDFLWLTQAERDTVSDDPDFRAGFGDPLQFSMPWRLVKDNQQLTTFLNPDGSRALSELLPIIAFLLYHELAHAVDFMPPDQMLQIDSTQTTRQAIERNVFLSTPWRNTNPIFSSTLLGLAQVSFLGEPVTSEQRLIQPADLIGEFTSDGVPQYYSYSTQFEDFANLFDTVMMHYHFGYEKDTAITSNAEVRNDGIVAWGQRGRLGEQATNLRARQVIASLYPGDVAAVEAFLNGLDAPQPLPTGGAWGNTVNLSTQGNGSEAGLPKRPSDDVLERRPIR